MKKYQWHHYNLKLYKEFYCNMEVKNIFKYTFNINFFQICEEHLKSSIQLLSFNTDIQQV